jgi:hypothetical protein
LQGIAAHGCGDFPNQLNNLAYSPLPRALGIPFSAIEPETGFGRRLAMAAIRHAGGGMTIDRTLAFAILMCMSSAAPALAQACTRAGDVVTCDDGRRGLLSGDAIIWPDGTRSSMTSPHPSVIIGNKSSVVVGQGVFVGKGKGVVPMENPSDPNRARCPVLEGVSYCY